MKQAQQQSLRPRISSAKRMAASPHEWNAFKVGDSVGVFLGNCWRKAIIVEMLSDCVVVVGKHLGSTQKSKFNVYDSRNIIHATELVAISVQEETFF